MSRQSLAIFIIFSAFIYLTYCDGKDAADLNPSSIIQYLLSQQDSLLQSIPQNPVDLNNQDLLDGILPMDTGFVDGAKVMEEREANFSDMERELRRELNGTPHQERIWPIEPERNNYQNNFNIEYDDDIPQEDDNEIYIPQRNNPARRRRVDPLGNRIPKPFNYGERNPYRLDDSQIYDPNNPYPIPSYPEDEVRLEDDYVIE